MKIFRSILVRKVAIYSLLASTLTGIGLSIIISKHISDDAINNKIEIVQFALTSANKMVQFEAGQKALTDSTYENLLFAHLNSNMRTIGVSDYFVWDKSGVMIQRLAPNQKNSYYTTYEPSESEWFKDSDVHKLITTQNNFNETWLKIKLDFSSLDNQQYLVVAIFPNAEIRAHQDMLIQNIMFTITSGLLLLYLLLIKVIGSASKTLIHQKDSLTLKNQELEATYEQLNISYHATIKALADSVDARDSYTSGHVNRVMTYSSQIGEALKLDQKTMTKLILAAQMHDIGKIGISDAVLLKPTHLNDIEYEIIKKHPEIGVSILKNIPDFKEILPAVLYHHERYDGCGYPSKLIGDEIPLEARIIALADSYDAMTTNRPYRTALSASEAHLELVRHKGTQFDPYITEVFIHLLQIL